MALLFATLPAPLEAQANPPSAGSHVEFPPMVQRPAGFSPTRGLGEFLPPAASAVVPGAGQLLLGQDRGVLYLVAEALFLTRFLTFAATAHREGDRFRDIAFVVARGPFSPSVRDTTFEYFEQMARFVESGPFDADPAPGLQPATDERTFNGRIWALARRTFFPSANVSPDPTSPAYQRALAFYEDRAIGLNFAWSWAGAEFQQDEFTRTIARRNDAARRRSAALGFLLANHMLSALDAFVSGRLSTGASLQTALWNAHPYSVDLAFRAFVAVPF